MERSVTVRPLSLTYTGTWRAATAETSFYLSYVRNLPGGMRGGSGAFDTGANLISLGARGLPTLRPGLHLVALRIYPLSLVRGRLAIPL